MTAATLELAALSKAYGGVQAVSALSLTVAAGTVMVLAGAAGAGKTTVLDLISGCRQPDGGAIRLDGRALVGLEAHRIAALGVARTFTPPRPFAGLSVEDTVVLAGLVHEDEVAEARRQALDLIDAVGLTAWRHLGAADLPLPGRKALELVRALAQRPRLLLLDEPLAGLDAVDQAAVLELLAGLVRRRRLTLVIAESEPEALADLAPRMVTLVAGPPPAPEPEPEPEAAAGEGGGP